MPKVAFLIPASPTVAFYSQIAAISRALHSLSWSNWEPSIHAHFGGELAAGEGTTLEQWLPHLQDVELTRVSQRLYANQGNWAQCDATIISAPRDADVLVSLDADTLPVDGFEDVLDRVKETRCIAGAIAHYPFPGATGPDDWNAMAQAYIGKTLEFSYTHSLVRPGEPDARRQAPFYLNGGVVFYSRDCFDAFALSYLPLREKLMGTMDNNDFSSQVATTLAIADGNIPTWSLPMRYNFPNDEVAEQLHPEESKNVVFHHYLRTAHFNRHEIFTTPEAYGKFMSLALHGPNLRFQSAVEEVLGNDYPFPVPQHMNTTSHD